MTQPRSTLVSLDATPWYHVVSTSIEALGHPCYLRGRWNAPPVQRAVQDVWLSPAMAKQCRIGGNFATIDAKVVT
jgi:hypothetical protein